MAKLGYCDPYRSRWRCRGRVREGINGTRGRIGSPYLSSSGRTQLDVHLFFEKGGHHHFAAVTIMAEDSKRDEVNKGSAAKPTNQGVCGTTLPTTTAVGICGNLATVVGVVIMNKYIQKHHGLNAMIFLSFCHLVTTTIGIRILLLVGFFRYKAAQTRAVAPVRPCGNTHRRISIYHQSEYR